MDKQTFIQKARELEPTFQPNDAVKARLAGLQLIAIVGPTGVGKSSIINACKIPYVISDMTRALRTGERDGVDINQRSDYDKLWSELENGEFAQFLVAITGEFYGTKASSYPASGPCTMPIVTSALPMFKNLGFGKIITVYVVPPSLEVWQKRIAQQATSDLEDRMVEARESLANALDANDYIFLVNDDLGKSLEDLNSILAGTYPPEKSLDGQKIAIELAQSLAS